MVHNTRTASKYLGHAFFFFKGEIHLNNNTDYYYLELIMCNALFQGFDIH